MGLGRINLNQQRIAVSQLTAVSSAWTVFDFFDVRHYKNCVLFIEYTQGAGESANILEIKIEHSPDENKTNAFQEASQEIGAGIDTVTALTHKFTAVAAPASYDRYIIPLDVEGARWLRVSVRETGVVTNQGTFSIDGNFGWQ